MSRSVARLTAVAIVGAGLVGWGSPARAQVDTARAARYFGEARALCERDGGRLWGVSLCGPMAFADAATRSIATSAPAPDAPRPVVLGFANTALTWGGIRWATFVWAMVDQLPAPDRARVLIHELFHRIQPELGLLITSIPSDNEHLDGLEGRYWLRLEWRALGAALAATGDARETAIRDALGFRSRRRGGDGGLAESERASEINEGLAQYTGTVVSSATRDAAVASAIRQLREAEDLATLVRTFAYPSGAGYGLLLDEAAPGWTRRIRATDDLGWMVAAATGLGPEPDLDRAAARYGGGELRAAEERRELERRARVADLRRRFVEGPVLVMPRGRNAAFTTLGVTPIPGLGTVYPSYRVTGEWGTIEAALVLVSRDGNTLTVPAAADGGLAGEGWKVTLAPGWVVRPGPRPGDQRVVRAEP